MDKHGRILKNFTIYRCEVFSALDALVDESGTTVSEACVRSMIEYADALGIPSINADYLYKDRLVFRKEPKTPTRCGWTIDKIVMIIIPPDAEPVINALSERLGLGFAGTIRAAVMWFAVEQGIIEIPGDIAAYARGTEWPPPIPWGERDELQIQFILFRPEVIASLDALIERRRTSVIEAVVRAVLARAASLGLPSADADEIYSKRTGWKWEPRTPSELGWTISHFVSMRFPEPTVSVLKALAETQGLEYAATMREAVIWHASSEGLAQSPDKLGIYVQGRIWKRRVPLSQRSHRNLKISFSVRDGAAWDAIMFVAQGEKWSISAAIVIQMLRRAKSLGFDIDVERECERLLMCEFEVIRAKKSIYALAEPGGIDVSVPSDLAYEAIMFVASQMNMPVGPAIAEVMREVATNLGWSSEDIPVRSLHSVT